MSPHPCGAGLLVAGLAFWWRLVRAGCRRRGGGVTLTGVWWPLAHEWRAGTALSHGFGRVSFLPEVSGGLPGLDPRLASLALAPLCALVRRAVLCCILLCCAMLFHAVLLCALLCRAVQCGAVVPLAVAWRGAPCCAAPRYVVLCCVVSLDALSRCAA